MWIILLAIKEEFNIKYIILFILIILSINNVSCTSDINDLTWSINHKVQFAQCQRCDTWEGNIIDSYYQMVLIKYENGQEHWLNFALVISMDDLKNEVK